MKKLILFIALSVSFIGNAQLELALDNAKVFEISSTITLSRASLLTNNVNVNVTQIVLPSTNNSDQLPTMNYDYTSLRLQELKLQRPSYDYRNVPSLSLPRTEAEASVLTVDQILNLINRKYK